MSVDLLETGDIACNAYFRARFASESSLMSEKLAIASASYRGMAPSVAREVSLRLSLCRSSFSEKFIASLSLFSAIPFVIYIFFCSKGIPLSILWTFFKIYAYQLCKVASAFAGALSPLWGRCLNFCFCYNVTCVELRGQMSGRFCHLCKTARSFAGVSFTLMRRSLNIWPSTFTA